MIGNDVIADPIIDNDEHALAANASSNAASLKVNPLCSSVTNPGSGDGSSFESRATKLDNNVSQDMQKDGKVEAIDCEQSNEILPESDLSDPTRRIWVVTTAALPWRTGTSVNPLLRALYLSRSRPNQFVSLMIPWLESEEDRKRLYKGPGRGHFENGEIGMESQAKWIRSFASKECGMQGMFLFALI